MKPDLSALSLIEVLQYIKCNVDYFKVNRFDADAKFTMHYVPTANILRFCILHESHWALVYINPDCTEIILSTLKGENLKGTVLDFCSAEYWFNANLEYNCAGLCADILNLMYEIYELIME